MRLVEGNATTVAMAAMMSISRKTRPMTPGALRAQRQAHADFAGALFGGVGEHTIEADRGEQHGQRRKADGEKREGALVGSAAVHLLFHGAQAIDNQRGVEPMNGLADGAFDVAGGWVVRRYITTPVGCFCCR